MDIQVIPGALNFSGLFLTKYLLTSYDVREYRFADFDCDLEFE